MSKTNNLGRGLDALFGSSSPSIDTLKFSNEEIVNLPIDNVIPNPDQPRKVFDEKAINELSQSIKEFGVLQPLVVTKSNDHKYMIVAGERRWRASKEAGLSKVPAIIRTVGELEKLEMGLIENVQREDLTPLEQAFSVQKLHEQFSMSYKDIASKLGKAYSTIANLIRLLSLPDNMKIALQDGVISEGHARSLLSLQADPQKQEILFNLIVKEHLSVRQAEQFVVASKQGASDKKAVSKSTKIENKETKKLAQLLGVKVTVHYTAKGGRIALKFNNEEELSKLIQKIILGLED